MGATGGIGGTYAIMPELYLKAYELFTAGKVNEARDVQNEICRIIYKMCSAHGNLYAVMKAILAKQGVACGSVRAPMPGLIDSDMAVVDTAALWIEQIIKACC